MLFIFRCMLLYFLELKLTILVLWIFILSLLNVYHFSIFVIILSMVYFNFSLFSLVNVIAVSSAYTISFTCWLLLNNNDRSFLYIINRRGPSIDPCGTPILLHNICDFLSFIKTTCFRLLR